MVVGRRQIRLRCMAIRPRLQVSHVQDLQTVGSLMMPDDNLDDAQRLAGLRVDGFPIASERECSLAQALALIDIGQSLREISSELRNIRLYGLRAKS